MDNQDLAERLKKLREANGYSLRDLAESIGSSANTVMRWERNESTPSQEFILKLADLYSRDPVWMTFGVKRPNANLKGNSMIETITTRLDLLSEPQLNAVHTVIALFLNLESQERKDDEAKFAE